jgi:hypothetical protein
VQIYNWVYSNIGLVPSFGSIQGSQLTLDKGQGNAFDTASLLIALLRASNIPSRYVFGTVNIPCSKVMNWVGGVTNANAALNLLGQGGIPNTGLAQGGIIAAVQMEHLWVDAYVSGQPSRGAKNLGAPTWIPLDASFKQYTYSNGANLNNVAPFDSQAFLNTAQIGTTIDSSNGWVQNLNQAGIQTILSNSEQQVQSYVDAQPSGAKIGDIIGKSSIVPRTASVLPSGLPYQPIAVAGVFSVLPATLQQQFQYSMYATQDDLDSHSPLWAYQTATVNLSEQKVTLVFVPATTEDLQAIESYIPAPHADGSPVQISEFPQSLPGYAINMTPEFRINGQKVAGSGSFPLGTALMGRGGFTTMDLGSWDLTSDSLVSGQSGAVGISLQGIAFAQASTLQSALANTLTQLGGSNPSSLTPQQVVDDPLSEVMACSNEMSR